MLKSAPFIVNLAQKRGEENIGAENIAAETGENRLTNTLGEF